MSAACKVPPHSEPQTLSRLSFVRHLGEEESGYSYNGACKKPWSGEPNPKWVSPQKLTDSPSSLLVLAADLNAWDQEPNGWTLAPHGRGGPIKQKGSVFMSVGGKTSRQVGAAGGNVGYLDGSVAWKPIAKMTNYWAFQGGIYYNAW